MSPSNMVLERELARLRVENERLVRDNHQAYLALRVIRPGLIGRWLLKREIRRAMKGKRSTPWLMTWFRPDEPGEK